MAKQLQLRRGTTAQHASFTGLVGEVTVDTDTDQLRVHDGATANGIIQGVPLGGIIAIASGITNAYTLPSTGDMGVGGWQLCDGASIPAAATLSGNVPTLNDARFLQGNTHANVGGTGGAASVTLSEANLAAHTHTGPSHTHTGPSHTHTGPSHTHSGPSHTHSWSGTTSNTGNHSHNVTTFGNHTTYAGGGGPNSCQNSTSRGTSNTGAHSHTVSGTTGASGTGNTGSSGTGATGAEGTGATGASGTGASGSTGSGSSFSIVPTYLRVVYVIRVA